MGSKFTLEEFKKLGAIPREACINSNKVGVYISELKRLAREEPGSVDDLKDSPLPREVEREFDFQVTIPIFVRIYEAITSILRREEERGGDRVIGVRDAKSGYGIGKNRDR